MGWWLAAPLISGATGLLGGSSAKKAAKKAARASAKLVGLENQEQLRRMDRDNLFRTGYAQAQMASSGLMMSGSTKNVMGELETEYRQQRNWTKLTGTQRQRVAAQSGNGVGTGQMIQGIGSILGAFAMPNPRVGP